MVATKARSAEANLVRYGVHEGRAAGVIIKIPFGDDVNIPGDQRHLPAINQHGRNTALSRGLPAYLGGVFREIKAAARVE